MTLPEGAGAIGVACAIGLGLVAVVIAALCWRALRSQMAQAQKQWGQHVESARAASLEAVNAAEAARRAAESAQANAQVAAGALQCAKSAEAAAAAAMRSADASVEAAQATRAVVELGKRAWVHATEFRASLKTQHNENSTLDVWIANLGTTPARELKLASSFLLCNDVPDELPMKPRVNNIVLGPGVSFSLPHFLRVTPADLAAITTGRRRLLACGRAEYLDVFGIARETQWCAIYDYSGNSFAPDGKHNFST